MPLSGAYSMQLAMRVLSTSALVTLTVSHEIEN